MGGPLANFAGLLHMTMHSLTKSAIFFAVGHIAQVKGTQKIADMGGLTVTNPVLGWGLVLGVVAIAGLPPLGIFMSEFLVVSSTFARAAVAGDARWSSASWSRFGALFLRLNGIAFGEPRGRDRAGASLLRADVRASRARAHGRHLSAAGAGRLVPERRQAAGIDAMALLDIIPHRETVAAHRPWPRAIVGDDGWQQRDRPCSRPGAARCSACGATRRRVHMALLDETPATIAVVSFACPDGTLSHRSARAHPPAIRLERAIRDLFGLDADRRARHAALARSRLLGRAPSARHSAAARTKPAPYAFLPAEGEGLHQIPVGPVHAGIIEPGHFRFTANGENVVRLEERLGYVHKGIESLMAGADARRAPRSSPAAPPATARSPMRSPSRRAVEAALQHRRRRRARPGCAR